MRYSPEALTAFVETVSCGSFSAAARRLRKSQSTISTAIAHLEADLGVQLFDRSSRQPVLTEEGKKVLSYVQAILSASERLDEVALSLSGETEARLTFVLSDTLHPDVLEELMVQFDRQFPHTEFECLIGEDVDVIDLLQKERAQVGLIEARDHYPTDIGATRLPMQTWMGLYVAASHPLAKAKKLQWSGVVRAELFAVVEYGCTGFWLVCASLCVGGGVRGGKTAGATGCSGVAQSDCYRSALEQKITARRGGELAEIPFTARQCPRPRDVITISFVIKLTFLKQSG